MKIRKLKINGFGKFVNKDISLNDGINIIYGLNESGKSTIQRFIPGVFFGLSKSKNGKEISNLNKYFPWNGLEYSGKISYVLDNGDKFEVFRDFNKKNPIIYNKNKIDISSDFNIDKNRGITFFEDQTGIDEKIFLETALVEQQNVKLDKFSQTNIIQKITNILASGDEAISYKKTIEKISKMQNEKVGTSRTTHKPINIIENNILKLEEEKSELENSEFELDEVSSKEIEIQNTLDELNEKLNLIKEMKLYLESSKLKYAELDFNKRLENEYDEKIQDLQSKIDIRAKQNVRLQKKKYTINYVFIFFSLILGISSYLYFNNFLVTIPFIIFILVNLLYVLISKTKNNKKIKEKLLQIDELQYMIDKEIEIFKKNKEKKQFENKVKSERLNVSILKNEEKLSEKYHGKVDETYIEKIFSLDVEELSNLELNLINEIDNLKMSLHTLKLEKENLKEKIKKIQTLNSDINILSKEKEELDSLNNSFKLALDILEESYKEMKENISPDFANRMSKMVNKISNGKYKNVIFDDINGLCVELDSGKYFPCEQLSIGTIDQIYLSLRLSVLEEITPETLPIILDETFAYFDNNRLENLLKFLLREYKDNQIIIFTCSNREVDILSKIQYNNYNYIEL